MVKTKFWILGICSFVMILTASFYTGTQSRKDTIGLLPWCYDMMGSPEEIDLIVVFRTNKFNVLAPYKAFRIDNKWFVSIPESLDTAISPINEQFVAWQKMP